MSDRDVFTLRQEFNKWCDSMTGFLFSSGAKSSDFYYEIWLAGRAAQRAASVPQGDPVAWMQTRKDGGKSFYTSNPLMVHDNGLPTIPLYAAPAMAQGEKP